MLCLCQLLAHAAYAHGWDLAWPESPEAERAAFASCTANVRDADALRRSWHGLKALMLATIFEHPEYWQKARPTAAGSPKPEFGRFDTDACAELMLRAHARPFDLLVPAKRSTHVHASIRVHRLSTAMPGSFVLIQQSGGLLIPSPAHHLFMRARELDELTLALVMSEYCGFYRMRPDLAAGHVGGLGNLATRKQLADFLDVIPHGAYGSARFKAALRLAFDGSASPRETAIAVLLTLPRRKGGAGLPRPLLNQQLRLSVESAILAGWSKVRPDFLWPEQRVCLEYQGADFHSGLERTQADNNRAAAFEQDGYRCLQVTNKQVSTPEQFALFAARVAELLGARVAPLDPCDPVFRAAHQAVMGARFVW